VRLFALDVRDEAHAAGVALEVRIIEALGLRQATAHGEISFDFVRQTDWVHTKTAPVPWGVVSEYSDNFYIRQIKFMNVGLLGGIMLG